jgi:hypothetical protein
VQRSLGYERWALIADDSQLLPRESRIDVAADRVLANSSIRAITHPSDRLHVLTTKTARIPYGQRRKMQTG